MENLLHIRDQLFQKESEAQEQADQLRKELLTLEDQHGLLLLQKNNELSQLQTELERTRSEAEIWVQDHIIACQKNCPKSQDKIKCEILLCLSRYRRGSGIMSRKQQQRKPSY